MQALKLGSRICTHQVLGVSPGIPNTNIQTVPFSVSGDRTTENMMSGRSGTLSPESPGETLEKCEEINYLNGNNSNHGLF